jgi:hypothetical protein
VQENILECTTIIASPLERYSFTSFLLTKEYEGIRLGSMLGMELGSMEGRDDPEGGAAIVGDKTTAFSLASCSSKNSELAVLRDIYIPFLALLEGIVFDNASENKAS